ncbi:MAG: hypothetical protein IM537_00635, partial [Pseudanabaena sp. M57BS1SP1A06MG]|nr:hypothetical protein [Pseudanabaena sp. M57BS1SP1A06MG]
PTNNERPSKKSAKQRSPIHPINSDRHFTKIKHRSPIKKINQPAIAYPFPQPAIATLQKSNIDRLSKKSINQRSPIHSHNQRSPL